MSDDTSDQNIVNRLNKLPPFADEEPTEAPIAPKEEPEEVAKEDTTENEDVKEEPKEEVTEEPVTEEKEALENSKNPERTKKFIDKLKEQNKALKKNVLDSLIPDVPTPPQYPELPTTNKVPSQQQYPGLSQGQINETFKGLIDDNGYVDSGLLIGTLKELQEKNRLAEERAKKAEEGTNKVSRQFDDFQRNQMMKEVHEKYPMLNPESDTFDERMWKYVRNEVIDQWMGGRQTDVMGAAKDYYNDYYMKKADKEKIEKSDTAKRNINATGVKQGSQRETYEDHEALVQANRLGKKGSLAERLARSGY